MSNGWFLAFGICIGLWAYWGALELRLINMDERIAVGTRYFVVDPALWWGCCTLTKDTITHWVSPPPAICSDEPIQRLSLTKPS